MRTGKQLYVFLLLSILLFSCANKHETDAVVKQFIAKEFNSCGSFECDSADYTIVSYIDSVGCVKCKLKLEEWGKIKKQTVSTGKNIPIVFVAHPSVAKDLKLLFRGENFYPDKLVVDVNNQIRDKNHIPRELVLQTFLVNQKSGVIVVGNPVHNSKIKELFFTYIAK